MHRYTELGEHFTMCRQALARDEARKPLACWRKWSTRMLWGLCKVVMAALTAWTGPTSLDARKEPGPMLE